MSLSLVIAVVGVALVFAYTNGFHDTANAIATSVATHALTPRIALTLAAIMNLVGALIGQSIAESNRIGISVNAVIEPPNGDQGLVILLSALGGAIAWNLATWWWGLPSSSTHALVGGLGGGALAAGTDVHWRRIVDDVVIPMLVSPVVGFVGAFALMLAIMWIFRDARPRAMDRAFRMLQTVSAAALALGHGLLDAQKTIGIICLALLASGRLDLGDDLPLWVAGATAAALALGTYAGGWRIIHTLGRRLADVDPARGFSAEAVGASVLYTTAFAFHAPISTTHTVTSAIMGAGATKRMSAVRWGLARTILAAWVLTFPMAGLIAWACYRLLSLVIAV